MPRMMAAIEEWGRLVTRSDLCFRVLSALLPMGYYSKRNCQFWRIVNVHKISLSMSFMLILYKDPNVMLKIHLAIKIRRKGGSLRNPQC